MADGSSTRDDNVLAAEQFQRAHGIVGHSPEMRSVVRTVLQVAPADITVLITGESGTGKEVIAKAIHSASRRASRKFIPVNCGAIPEGILESELFGHEKGSFTGAAETRKGYFEIADGGTIFLDEIGDTPMTTQVKLLRVLENGEFMRVGSSEPRHVDVRVIAATNKDLEEEVQTHRFRQDLYFRLRSINIRIPPLRSRRGDIAPLIETFMKEARRKNPANTITLTDDAVAALVNYSWPGNVRELRNFIESLSVLEHDNEVDGAAIGRLLYPESNDRAWDRALPVYLGKSSEQAERELILRALFEIRSEIHDLRRLIERYPVPDKLALPAALDVIPSREIRHPAIDIPNRPQDPFENKSLEEIEKLVIERTLERFDGNRRMAAKILKISERTLYRKIEEYGLK
jgi:transcriptional regulator with PAS, ATPase and Fis domain